MICVDHVVVIWNQNSVTGVGLKENLKNCSPYLLKYNGCGQVRAVKRVELAWKTLFLQSKTQINL